MRTHTHNTDFPLVFILLIRFLSLSYFFINIGDMTLDDNVLPNVTPKFTLWGSIKFISIHFKGKKKELDFSPRPICAYPNNQ